MTTHKLRVLIPVSESFHWQQGYISPEVYEAFFEALIKEKRAPASIPQQVDYKENKLVMADGSIMFTGRILAFEMDAVDV